MLVLLISIVGVLFSIYSIVKLTNEISILEKSIFILIGSSFLMVSLSYLQISKYLFLIYISLILLAVLLMLPIELKRKSIIPSIILFLWFLSLLYQTLNLPYWKLSLTIKGVLIIPLSIVIF